MASIKVLTISLVLLCIFTSAFVCTFLAIASSNKALDDTKKSRDLSVDSAFKVGSVSVTNRTKEYVNLLMSSTEDYFQEFTKVHRLVSASIAHEVAASPWDVVKKFEWHHLQRYFQAFTLRRPDGNTGVALLLKNKLTIATYEDSLTLSNPPDAYHSLLVSLNYGDDSPYGGYGRTFIASADENGYPIGVTNPITDVNWTANPVTCQKTAVATNGSVPDPPCAGASDWLDPSTSSLFYVGIYLPAAPGHAMWSPPYMVDNQFIGMNCFTSIYHNGTYTGVLSASAELRRISQHLASLPVSGPVDGYPSRGRVFITLRSTWLTSLAKGGEVIGVSHGESIGRDKNGAPRALYLNESTDYIIRTVAAETKDLDLDALAVAENMTVLNITTELSPYGEEFYYRVGRLYDEHGLDWYIHLVIDRAYILGHIDKEVLLTHEEIDKSESKVDRDLHAAQTVLYICIVAVAVGLTVLSIILVLKIIAPLNVLEKEMAAVAVMRLEAVDMNRPLASLEEVRLMQVSFLQMTRNLVEYRNYMPASVLHDDDDDDTSAPENEKCGSKNGSKDGSSTETSKLTFSVSGGSSHCKPGHLASDVRVKRVTLMVCNMVGFLQEAQHVQSTISSYLTACLQNLKSSKGIPDSFSGDRLYASWNGARPCSSHRWAAYHCARSLCHDKSVPTKLSIGLVSGEVKCGNMGCEGMKKYSYIGSLSSWVHLVERIGRSVECDVAIDAAVNEEVCNRAYTRMLQHVVFTKHSRNMLRVYEAMGHKEVAEEEWMYQLREGQSKDPNKEYNSSYELFMAGNVTDALKKIEGVDDGSMVLQMYKERVRAAITNPMLFEPLGRAERLYN